MAGGHARCAADHTRAAKIEAYDLSGLEVGEDFFVMLGDGVLLCSIINTIKPGTISKVRTLSPCARSAMVDRPHLGESVGSRQEAAAEAYGEHQQLHPRRAQARHA